MKELLRKCPSCGRRFVLKIDSKKLVDVQHSTERLIRDFSTYPFSRQQSGAVQGWVDVKTTEDVPIELDEYEVTYDCRHCHHTWTEKLTEALNR
jgi:hypothetical protein